MKRFILPLIGLFVFPHFLFSAGERQLLNQVIAVVNNDVITEAEFDTVFRPLYEEVKKNHKGTDLNKQINDIRLKLLNQMIEDKLVYQEAVQLGLEVSETEVNEQIEEFKKQFPNTEAFEKEMKESGITTEHLKKQFRERLAVVRLHQYMIRGKVAVSPAEMEGYFKDHSKELAQEEQVELWSITIRKSEEAIEKGMADEVAEARAQSLLEEVRKGADFGALAKKNSQDQYAEKNGYLGFVERGVLVDDVDRIVFALPEGNLSEVLETERGYHIFKAGKKNARKDKTFEEAKEEIKDLLFRQKAHERFTKWMEELKQKSYISIR